MTDMRMTAEEKKEFTLTLLRFFSSEIDDIPDVSEIYNQKMRKEREALTQYVRQRFIDIEQIGIEKIGTDKLTQDKMDIAIKSIVANIVGEALSDVYKEIDAEAIISESEQQAAIEQVTQTIKSIVPQNHVMPNNTLMNVLQSKEVINAGAFDMSVMPATKRRKEVTAYVDVSMETQTDSDYNFMDYSQRRTNRANFYTGYDISQYARKRRKSNPPAERRNYKGYRTFQAAAYRT